MRFSTLDEWLAWQEQLHPTDIELGLERVREVYARLCPPALPFMVITVAGTNGKGSSVALLQAILLAAGYRVGSYTSPHLLRYNERIRLNGDEVSDPLLIHAFEQVDQARQNISLTYFEFGTLAALRIFCDQPLDVVILEVGLGGRLDAVNVVDADMSLITSIAIDHVAWLGNDRESIGREKAGIMRAGRAVVCSDPRPPASIADHAAALNAQLYQLDVDYQYTVDAQSWDWSGPADLVPARHGLPHPALRGAHQFRNAAGVLMVLALLQTRLPVNQQHIRQGLHSVSIPGRLQWLAGAVPQLLDVAHNPDGVQQLAAALTSMPVTGRTWAVVGMMRDKDARTMLAQLLPLVDGWYPVNLPVARAADSESLARTLRELVTHGSVTACESVSDALRRLESHARAGDRIVIFGSFYTVAEALAQRV